MKRTFLTFLSMAFICAMTLTGCAKDDNPTGAGADSETMGGYEFAIERDAQGAYYVVDGTAALDALAAYVNSGGETIGKRFKMTADITYSHKADGEEGADTEKNFTPIGYNDQELGHFFYGTFDGDGHTISGIRIYGSADGGASSGIGLFGATYAGVVQGVTLADARITGSRFTGGIVGVTYGRINDCHVASDVTIHAVQSEVTNLGGICGWTQGSVSYCTSSVKIILGSSDTKCKEVGGIAGRSYPGPDHNLVSGAVIPAAKDYSHGAICGYSVSTNLDHNYYYNCKVASDDITPAYVGVGNMDATGNDGAVPATILSETEAVPSTMTGKVAFRRTFTGGKATSICLPFAYTPNKNEGKYYMFTAFTKEKDEYFATMTETTGTLAANTPYMFIPASDKGRQLIFYFGEANYDVSGELATTIGVWSFKGTYEPRTYGKASFTGWIYDFVSKMKTVDGVDVEAGQFVEAEYGTHIPSLSCYLQYKDEDPQPKTSGMKRADVGSENLPETVNVRFVSATGE